MPKVKDSKEFFLWDYSSTLFPLKLNRLLVESDPGKIHDFVNSEILPKTGAFLPQHRVFATKRGWFLRRTVKLDPVAELFIYDLMYRNRSCFRKVEPAKRSVFGFQIQGGEPISGLSAYAQYKAAIAANRSRYKHRLYLDVASYFNHIYHHDLVRWFEDAGASAADVQAFGKFLRETASGRTVDCLPHGLYATKMVGSSFLSFLDESSRIKAAQVVRMMDDIWLFDDDQKQLIDDFMTIQMLLSDKGLSVNAKKSTVLEGPESVLDLPPNIDEIKIELLRKRREELGHGGPYGDDSDEQEEEWDMYVELTAEEHEYLIILLKDQSLQEEDAELVLSLMGEHSADVVAYLPVLVAEFPNLTKRIYHFCRFIKEPQAVTRVLIDYMKSDAQVAEFQLFWFGAMLENYLLDTEGAVDLLQILYEHPNATSISKAKILEISDRRYGLPELREEQLRTGHSDWTAWAAAIGARAHPKGQRNHLLKYFRKASPMNRLIGEFVETFY